MLLRSWYWDHFWQLLYAYIDCKLLFLIWLQSLAWLQTLNFLISKSSSLDADILVCAPLCGQTKKKLSDPSLNWQVLGRKGKNCFMIQLINMNSSRPLYCLRFWKISFKALSWNMSSHFPNLYDFKENLFIICILKKKWSK